MQSGPPGPMGAGQSVSSSLLRSNSGMLGGQGGPGPGPSQNAFPSLVPQRAHFNSMNMLGNILNASSQLSQSLGNGPNGVFSGPGSNHRGGIDTGAESDPLSGVGNGMAFSAPPQSSFGSSDMTVAGMSGQAQGQQFSSQSMPDQNQSQHLEQQSFQQNQQPMQQFPVPHNTQQQLPQQPQFPSFRGGLSGVGHVRLDSQMANDQLGPQQQQQIQPLRNLSQVKIEPQEVPAIRNLSTVKMEPQHTNPPPYLQQQQQQQQQFMLMSRQPSQAAAAQISMLHQQRVLQLQQQHQQQQAMKVIPQQRAQMLQQFQQQNMPLRSPVKSPYEPGTGAKRLTEYMYQQQHRPEDNNIEFWRKFVAEFFAPHAKKKWCVSLYGMGRQPPGVFPQDVWHCDICNRKPGRGFDATVEVLPRLFKIKYDSGTLEELLYVDLPREYQNPSGQIILDYAKAIQESVFEPLRVVRDGQLRIVFSRDLKISSWEFCARHHEELIPRKLLIPQVNQLGAAAQKYQAAAQNASSSISVPDLQNNCNMLVSSARQLSKAIEVPLVNELGYTKRYIRCLQIAEVVNSMKDLIDYSRETGTGPMDSLAKLARRTTSSGFQNQAQESEEQQQQQANTLSASSEPNSVQAAGVQLASSNGGSSINNSMNAASTSAPANSIVGLLHQNSMNSRQQVSVSNAGSPYGGSNVQIQSPGSSSTMPQSQPNASPFHSPTPSSSNNPVPNPHNSLPAVNQMNLVNPQSNVHMQQPAISREADPSDSQSSVQKMLQDLMSSPLNGAGGVGSLGNEMKHPNGILPSINTGLNNASGMMGNGPTNNSINGGAGFGAMGMGLGQSAIINGLRGNSVLINGRVGMAQIVQGQSMNHQQDMSNQLLNGLGAGNGFNNLQFDWKPSP